MDVFKTMGDLDNETPSPTHDDLAADNSYPINPDTFYWTYQAMKVLFKFVKLTINIHGDENAWEKGHIFLFNHFARFEAIIPQYIIYQKTNQLTRSIATKELFSANELVSKYLLNLGGIPTDTEQLMYHVSKDILNSIKLIAFPEGGIVKDRRVLDKRGKYSVYSRSDDKRRKLHTGPAVIGLTIAIFKASVRQLNTSEQTNISKLEHWANEIGLSNTAQLIEVCEQPTIIIPCNITFYPLRVKENTLVKGIKLLQPDLKERLSEELLIEGNLLLKDTDMDIQILEPIVVEEYWSRWETTIASLLADHSNLPLAELFNTVRKKSTWGDHIYEFAHRRNANKIRDAYMYAIYSGVTINIAHLASSLFSYFVNKQKKHINKKKFHELLYIATKLLQQHKQLNFHKTLQDPSTYRNILFKNTDGFDQFLRSVYAADLIQKEGAYYVFTGLLSNKPNFDSIRFQNPVTVYSNEVAPIKQLQEVIKKCLAFKPSKRLHEVAEMLFDDELIEHQIDIKRYQQKRYKKINNVQPATTFAKPFILRADKNNGQCVVLIHGLLSSPAEMRPLAEKLYNQGYIVLATRLKGHGTSPWELNECSWQDWQQSIKQMIKIAQCYSKKTHLVGFSSGGLLALHLSANRNVRLASITACSTPIEFKDPLIKFIKIADTTNRAIKSITGGEGLMTFKDSTPEHPNINYKHIPISAINQLLELVKKTKPRLKRIHCPVYLIQADNDPVVDSSSMGVLLGSINPAIRHYDWISSNRHGILYENTGNCQQKIVDYINSQHHIA